MKPPPGWAATWKPDYQHNGMATGIQVYAIQVDGDNAVVLCLVGSTHAEQIDGLVSQCLERLSFPG